MDGEAKRQGEQQKLMSCYSAARYLSLIRLARNAGLDDIAAKQSLSLLTLLDCIPADKASAHAGENVKSDIVRTLGFLLIWSLLPRCRTHQHGDRSTEPFLRYHRRNGRRQYISPAGQRLLREHRNPVEPSIAI